MCVRIIFRSQVKKSICLIKCILKRKKNLVEISPYNKTHQAFATPLKSKRRF